jgi:hypothetical protein
VVPERNVAGKEKETSAALKYARPFTPVMYLSRWKKQGDKIGADVWYTRIYSKHSVNKPIG